MKCIQIEIDTATINDNIIDRINHCSINLNYKENKTKIIECELFVLMIISLIFNDRQYFDSDFRHFDFILFNNKASVNYKRHFDAKGLMIV